MQQQQLLVFTALLSALKLTESTYSAGFVKEPSSINITEGLTATFNCTAHCIGYFWKINNKLPEHSENAHRGYSIDTRTINSTTNLKEFLLNLPATPVNDKVTVQCFIYDGPVMVSNVSRLLIQGRLSTVSEIEHTQLNNTSILLTYTPPSTLAGVPISNYSLEFGDKDITQWTSGNNVVINILPDDYCDTQLITVSAWNGVGKGEPLNYTYTLYHVPSPTFSQSNTLSYSTSGTTVLLHSKVNNTDCIGKRPNMLRALIERKGEEEGQSLSCSLYDVGNSSCPEVTIESDSSTVWSITVNITSLLQQKQHYTAQLVFSNNKGNITETVRTFSTYQVQNTNVTHTISGIICITCEFLPGSSISGCYVVLIDVTHSGSSNQSLFIPRITETTGTSCPATLYRGYYTMYVYEGNAAVESSLAIVIDNIFINTTLTQSISSTLVSDSTTEIQNTRGTTTDSISSSVSGESTSTNNYISATSSLTITNSKTPTVNTTQGSGGIDSFLLTIIAFIIGIILTLTIVGLISLSYCLVKTKKKNKKLKIAELAATEKFKHADVLLQSLRLPPYHASSLSPSHAHHSPPPSSPTTEPMYDNIEDKKKPRIQAVNIQATLPEIQPCPAYSVPPALPPPIHRPNIGNMQQQGLYIERD